MTSGNRGVARLRPDQPSTRELPAEQRRLVESTRKLDATSSALRARLSYVVSGFPRVKSEPLAETLPFALVQRAPNGQWLCAMRFALKMLLSFIAGSALAFLVMQPGTEHPRELIESIRTEDVRAG